MGGSVIMDESCFGGGKILLPSLFCYAFRGFARCFYLSDAWIYNPRKGYFDVAELAPTRDAHELVGFMADVLAGISSMRGAACPQHSFQPRLLMTCTKLKLHRTFDGEGLVIDQWRGEVKRAIDEEACQRRFVSLGSYANARELVQLLDDGGVFLDS